MIQTGAIAVRREDLLGVVASPLGCSSSEIALLARAHDGEVPRPAGDDELGDLAAALLVADDEQAPRLGAAAGRRAKREPKQPVEHLVGHRPSVYVLTARRRRIASVTSISIPLVLIEFAASYGRRAASSGATNAARRRRRGPPNDARPAGSGPCGVPPRARSRAATRPGRGRCRRGGRCRPCPGCRAGAPPAGGVASSSTGSASAAVDDDAAARSCGAMTSSGRAIAMSQPGPQIRKSRLAVRRTCDHHVVAVPAEQHVGTDAGVQGVVATAAVDPVVARASQRDVVAPVAGRSRRRPAGRTARRVASPPWMTSLPSLPATRSAPRAPMRTSLPRPPRIRSFPRRPLT